MEINEIKQIIEKHVKRKGYRLEERKSTSTGSWYFKIYSAEVSLLFRVSDHKTKKDNVSLISFALVLYTANNFLALQNVINCQVVDPLLNVDFSLAENSPCIDAGLAYSNKAYDFNGQTRVSNGKIDIGAIEKILAEDVIKAFYYNSERIVKIYFGENLIAKLIN